MFHPPHTPLVGASIPTHLRPVEGNNYMHPSNWTYTTNHDARAYYAPQAPLNGQGYFPQPYPPHPNYYPPYPVNAPDVYLGTKRALESPIPSAPAKRQRARAAVSTNEAQQQANLAASSLPPTYYTDPHYDTSQRPRASRAIDCWLFVQGTDLACMPNSEEVGALCVADAARMNGELVDLKRPQGKHLRCTECLKLGIWRSWKNNDNGGVSYAIRAHLRKRHPSAYQAGCERIGFKLEGFEADQEVNEPITPQGILRYLVEWFAEDDISFNTLTHRGFRRFFSYISQGNACVKDIPDRHTVAKHVDKLCEDEKERIKNEIKNSPGRVSCTADLWTDEAQRAFMCITVHFFRPLKQMVDYLIAFRVIEGSHTGSNLAETFFSVLDEYGVTEKLGMITLDNASNNDSFMAQLEDYMRDRGLYFDRYANRIRCFPHVVNLAVQAILKKLKESAEDFQRKQLSASSPIPTEYEPYVNSLLTNVLARCRAAVVALRFGQRRQGLQKTIRDGNRDHIFFTHKWINKVWTQVQQDLQQLELVLDVETRWSSTRDMIDRFIYLYQAISKYIASVPALTQYRILHEDFEVLQDLRTVLNVAHRTQELLSSDKTPTLSFALPLYHALIQRWRTLQSNMPALSYAIGAGIAKLQDYVNKARSSPAHILAMALNPSIRYSWIEKHWSPEEARRAKELVEEHLLLCLEEQQARHQSSKQNTALSSARTAGELAEENLSRGYEAFLDDEGDLRPVASYRTSYSPTSSASTSRSRSPATPPLESTSSSSPSPDLVDPPSPTTLRSDIRARNLALVKLEHEAFLEQSVVPPQELKGTTAIEFWKARSGNLPLVYQLALNVLPAQASSVSSERVFSSSKMTCTQSRNRISAGTVESLQILKHSLRRRPDVPLSASSGTLDLMAHHIDGALGDSAVSTIPVDID